MNRRQFIATATLSTAGAALAMAQANPEATKAEHGACGLSCAACRMQLNGKCDGCGKGAKAECAILKCAQTKKLRFCAQCKGYPCAKIKDSGKFGAAWLDKMANASVPAS
jgi:hypothetical protein